MRDSDGWGHIMLRALCVVQCEAELEGRPAELGDRIHPTHDRLEMRWKVYVPVAH